MARDTKKTGATVHAVRKLPYNRAFKVVSISVGAKTLSDCLSQ